MSVIADYTGNSIRAEDASVLLPAYEYITFNGITTTAGSTTIYVNPSLGGTYQVAGATVTFSTASTSGTITVKVDTSTNAPGAGTAQLTGTMSLSGTANTPVNGTVISSPNTISAGDRVSFTTAGTLTNLAGGTLTVILKRIS